MTLANQTAHTFERMYEFNKRHVSILRPLMITLYSVACAVLAVGLMLLTVPFFLAGRANEIEWGLFVICILFMALGIYRIFGYTVLFRHNIRKRVISDTVAAMRFDEDIVEVITDAPSRGLHSELTLPYSAILKVTESANAYYLYVDKRAAHIVAKDGFTEGTLEDLKTLLREKIEPKKLKIK